MPTTAPPPPPKQGGSGPFIAAVIIMLLLMGGILYWKLGGSSNEPVAAKNPEPTVATAVPKFDEPPPPPPPAEEPKDAGTENKQPAKHAVVSAPGGCAAECTGTASAGLRGQLGALGGRARGCYERALRQNPQLQGRMTVNIRVSPTGSVCSARVGSNELGDPGIASCVLRLYQGSTFSAPQGGCADFAVPLNFTPKI